MFYLKRLFFEENDGAGNDLGGTEPSPEPSPEPSGPAWPDTWREMYAGEDKGKLAKLSRYASPTAAFDAMISAQNKISSGEYKQIQDFPMNGSEEEQKAWREENGIPEAPDKYNLEFDDGLVIGEEDKPIIDDFLSAAHQANMPPSLAKAAIQWYYSSQEKQAESRYEADNEAQELGEDELRSEWGEEYKANLNRIHGLLDTAPEGVKDKIMNSRLQDGTPLASDPNTLRFLVDLALQINPATTLVPGAGNNLHGAISDELASLEAMMGNRNSEYWKGPKAEAHQKRFRELVTARDKMKAAV